MENDIHAFPHRSGYAKETLGMTLRDYFAGQVLLGLCSSKEVIQASSGRKEEIVRRAYEMADIMLKQRGEQ